MLFSTEKTEIYITTGKIGTLLLKFDFCAIETAQMKAILQRRVFRQQKQGYFVILNDKKKLFLIILKYNFYKLYKTCTPKIRI